MDRPSYLEEDYSSLDGLDDDVFHSDDFGLAGQPGEMTATGIFTQNQSYSCLLGRFQLFPLTHCCGPGVRHPEQQDKATQTLSPSSSSQDVMLPCGVTEEPRRLFYGNAGYRLHVPPVGFALDPHLQEEPQEGQQEARAEVQIARKLQCIADQFHRLHIQRVHVLPPCLLPTGWLRREHCLESKWSGKMPGGLPMLMTPSRGQLNLNQLIPFFPVHQT
ncbi:bcl-2-modifying factor isoform X1 [Anser cygnoides]|uniref:bcl-2-modifying factor isoform X1 n=1 Tax=Anser cygnoides TaxID=8845 RepID=UPI0020092D1A|nr:bcl-2-modifying factor isoform X1 [Anser cygnoides]XP_047936576.1 bcl-2-modifying factor isoform X1 [Anser cygnoides]